MFAVLSSLNHLVAMRCMGGGDNDRIEITSAQEGLVARFVCHAIVRIQARRPCAAGDDRQFAALVTFGDTFHIGLALVA